ncbi:MAG TPA: ABC transporter ATP-binding protein, partial [Nitriliruptorales bacterium]
MNQAPPVEFDQKVRAVLAREPEHAPAEVVFDRRPDFKHRFTLWRFLRPQWPALVLGVILVAVETVAQQAGPLLTQRAIDRGVIPGQIGPVVHAAGLFVIAVIVGQSVTRARIAWTGRLGQRLIKRLRVDVFTHLQRLSQSFFTEERIGRVLTRMTSDIDALQQLLQDGIVNLVVQAFTLVIITGVLFAMNAELALVVVAAVVPVMIFLTLWFRGASDRTYNTVRERIADVLTDLQENLAGVRQVIGFNRQRYNEVAHRNIVGQHRDAKVGVGRVQGIYGPSVDA